MNDVIAEGDKLSWCDCDDPLCPGVKGEVMDDVIAEIIECNKAIEHNLDSMRIDRWVKASTDWYYRELRCDALATLKCWAYFEDID